MLAGVVLLISATSYGQQPVSLSVDRAWGLLLGDEMTVTVTLPADVAEIDNNALPQPERRYGAWLYLQRLELINNTVLFHYQLVNVPKQTMLIDTLIFEVYH